MKQQWPIADSFHAKTPSPSPLVSFRPIDVNTDTMTTPLVARSRRLSVPRSWCRRRSPRCRPHHHPLVAPCCRCRRRRDAPLRCCSVASLPRHAIATGLRLRVAHGPPNLGDGPKDNSPMQGKLERIQHHELFFRTPIDFFCFF